MVQWFTGDAQSAPGRGEAGLRKTPQWNMETGKPALKSWLIKDFPGLRFLFS